MREFVELNARIGKIIEEELNLIPSLRHLLNAKLAIHTYNTYKRIKPITGFIELILIFTCKSYVDISEFGAQYQNNDKDCSDNSEILAVQSSTRNSKKLQ